MMNFVKNLGNGQKLLLAIAILPLLVPALGLVLELLNVDPAVFVCYFLYVAVFSVILNGEKLVYLCNS